ncbi:unnamed protein product [Urochloa humidicola]
MLPPAPARGPLACAPASSPATPPRGRLLHQSTTALNPQTPSPRASVAHAFSGELPDDSRPVERDPEVGVSAVAGDGAACATVERMGEEAAGAGLAGAGQPAGPRGYPVAHRAPRPAQARKAAVLGIKRALQICNLKGTPQVALVSDTPAFVKEIKSYISTLFGLQAVYQDFWSRNSWKW